MFDMIIPLSPSRRREAPCEGTNSPRLFTPGETKALAKSKVHQLSRAWVTNHGWSSSLISKIWRTVINSGHWLVQFKVCIITTAWRQRNSKHFLTDQRLDTIKAWFHERFFSAKYFACFFWITTTRINYFYLIAHNSKETGEIFRISPRKSARGIRP
jgi:hypothetical protein